MLKTIFLVMLGLWALGMVMSDTTGGFIHILLLLAFEALLIHVVRWLLAVFRDFDRLFNLSL